MRNCRCVGILIHDLHGDRCDIPRSIPRSVLPAQEGGGRGKTSVRLGKDQWTISFTAKKIKRPALVSTSDNTTKHTDSYVPNRSLYLNDKLKKLCEKL